MSCGDIQYQSCKQLAQLYHDYSDVQPIDLQDVPCDSPTHAVILSLFSLGELYGSTLDSIIQTSQQHCPYFTSDEIQNALQTGIQSGLFRTLRPIVIDYQQPLPPTRYTLSENMDRNNQNQEYVRFLVGLVGGLHGTYYKHYFRPYISYKPRGFKLYKFDF